MGDEALALPGTPSLPYKETVTWDLMCNSSPASWKQEGVLGRGTFGRTVPLVIGGFWEPGTAEKVAVVKKQSPIHDWSIKHI